MRKYLASVLLVAALLAVGGCARLTRAYDLLAGTSISQTHIDFAHEAYSAGFLSWAAEYRGLYNTNPCPAGVHATLQNVCAERSVVEQLQATDKIVESAFSRLQEQYDSCVSTSEQQVCSGLKAAYDTLSTAIDAAKALALQYRKEV